MKIIKGTQYCNSCGRLNKLSQMFNSFIYEECEYCNIVQQDKIYTIYCITFNNEPNKSIISIQKPGEIAPEFIKVVHSYKEAKEIITEIYERYGGTEDIISSNDWKETYFDSNGFETDEKNMDEFGQTTASFEFEGI